MNWSSSAMATVAYMSRTSSVEERRLHVRRIEETASRRGLTEIDDALAQEVIAWWRHRELHAEGSMQ